jgi:general secretion pathway protein D
MADTRHATRVIVLLVVLLAGLGCATTTSSVRQARELFGAGDYDRACVLLQREAAANPRDGEIKTLLLRAQLGSYQRHLFLARSRRQAGDRAAAIGEYQKALAVFPANRELQAEIDAYASPQTAAREEKPKPTIVPPVQLGVRPDERASLALKNIPITSIFKSLGKTFGVNFIFDKDFRDFLHSLEIENATFQEVLKVLCLVSGSQYRVLDAATVLVYPDIFAKKRALDLRGIKAFYLSNIKAEDARKMVQAVFRDEQLLIQEDANLNALVVRADYNSLADVERFLVKIDKEKSEVEVHVEILEINRTLANKLGAEFASGAVGFSAGTVGSDGAVSSLMNVNDLGSTNFFLTIPSVAMNFLESDNNSKILAKPNLRGLDGEEISFMVGDEVPVPETQYQAIAAGGINTSPVTTYRYRNVGVEIKITPFIHQNNEVTLKTKLTINFISSGASSSFPTFGKREIENKIRLKEGETNIIGGLIRDDVRGSLSGFPALSRIPLLGKLFGNSQKSISQTDLIFSITPKIIRRTPISRSDNEAIWGGEPATPAAGAEAPAAPVDAVEGDRPAPPPQRPETSDNRVTVSPNPVSLPANSEAFFSLNVQAGTPLASLALNGTVSGGEILDILTDALNENEVKILKNVAGNSFDLGLSFTGNSAQAPAAAQVRLKVRFAAKGRYQLSIGNIKAYDARRQPVSIAGTTCAIDVF